MKVANWNPDSHLRPYFDDDDHYRFYQPIVATLFKPHGRDRPKAAKGWRRHVRKAKASMRRAD